MVSTGPFRVPPSARPAGPVRAPERPSPGSYAGWVSWLEAFRRGEEPDLEGLEPIDGRLAPFVEARLLDRLSAAVTERVRRWRATLAEDVMAAPPTDEAAVAVLLGDATRRLDPLERLAASPLLPTEVAAAMRVALVEVRDGAREALKDARRRMDEETLELPVVRHTEPTARTGHRSAHPFRGSRAEARGA